MLAQRRPNRGMEGLALDAASGRLHGFLQSPIDPKDGAGKSIKAKPPGGSNTDVRHIAKFARWLEFDPATETSKMYAYPIDGSQYDKDRTGNAKLGDMVSLGDGRFIVIEQGARKSDAKVVNKLMLVEIPADATDIAALDHNLEISSITQAVSGAADWSAVVPMKKTELLDLNALGWLAEKAEGLTLVDENTLALVNDNDFGVCTIAARRQRPARGRQHGGLHRGRRRRDRQRLPGRRRSARASRAAATSSGRPASGCCASSASWGSCGCRRPEFSPPA